VHATGQHLAANQTNDGGSGNAKGWFGSAAAGNTVPTPAFSGIGLLLLALLLVGFSARAFATFRRQE
jgi:hypothetical protein